MSSTPALPSPFFLLDESRLLENYQVLRDAFFDRWSNLVVGYSFKTNPLPWVITRLKHEGAWAEVVSDREYDLAQRLGYRPDQIILNGPVKGLDCLRRALEDGAVVNLDSFSEIEWIETHRPAARPQWDVGLRVNFDLEAACPGETVAGDEPGRFGFCLEDGSFLAATHRLLRLPHVRVRGVHGHHSTRSRSVAVFTAIVDALVQATGLLPHPVDYVDVGGGFFGGRSPSDPRFLRFPAMGAYATAVCSSLRTAGFDSARCRLILEPGACVVATAFEYHCTVVDVKDVRGARIVTLDGSRLDIAPNSQVPLECRPSVAAPRPEHPARQVLCGYSCIEMDRLVELPPGAASLAPGDVVVFAGVGGYGMSMAPLFIRYLKSVYVRPSDGSEPFSVRTEWTAEQAQLGCRAHGS